MQVEMLLSYLFAVPFVLLFFCYIAPWSISDAPSDISHFDAFRFAVRHVFIEHWFWVSLITIFWLPALLLACALLLVVPVLFLVFLPSLQKMMDEMLDGDEQEKAHCE